MNRDPTSIRAYVAFCVLVQAGSPVLAETFPTKALRLIVPAAPGSSTDVLARRIGQKLSDKWKQVLVIDNRAGAGGTLGAGLAAKATPDGYTMIMVNAGFSVSAALYKKLPYDPVKEFAAVGTVGRQPLILIVNPTIPISSVEDLISTAKSRPNELTLGSPGNGSIGHLVAEMFKWRAGVRMLHVPYKGAGPAVNALISGEIQALFPGIVPALPHIKSGKLRALAVSTADRSNAVPDVPTLSEAGIRGFDESNWQGVLAPTGTPPEVIRLFNAELGAAVASADVRSTLRAAGTEAFASDPASFERFLVAEIAKWRKLIKDSGTRID